MGEMYEFHPGHADQSVHGRSRGPATVPATPPRPKKSGAKKSMPASPLTGLPPAELADALRAHAGDPGAHDALRVRSKKDLLDVAAKLHTDGVIGKPSSRSTKAQLVADILDGVGKPAPADAEPDPKPATPAKKRPYTEKTNAGFLHKGDQWIDDDGTLYRVVAHVNEFWDDGVKKVLIQVEDQDTGDRKEIIKGRNQSISRVPGGGGGGGTFDDGSAENEAFNGAVLAELFQGRMPDQLVDYYRSPAGAKHRLGSRGAFRRCQRQLLSKGVPPSQVDGACSNLILRVTGKRPTPHKGGEHGMNQTACGCGGVHDEMAGVMCPAGKHLMPDGTCMDDADMAAVAVMDMTAPSVSMGWRGPLAPVDIATGDRRRIAAGALSSRQLPLPLRWQERGAGGHEGAVVVGALTGYEVGADGMIGGVGYFLDPEIIPEVRKAMHLIEHKLVGPSIDLEPDMDVSYVDPQTGMAFDPAQCVETGSCPAKPHARIDRGTVTGATLVPITAFAEARAPELFSRTVADDVRDMSRTAISDYAQVASVPTGGLDHVPFADMAHDWDPAGAAQRLADWAFGDITEPAELGVEEWDEFATGHLYRAPQLAESMDAYLFQVCDVVNDTLMVIPAAVFAAAARLDTADIRPDERAALREVIEDLYGQMAEELAAEDLHAPWEKLHTGDDCGCADKFARAVANQSASGQYGVFGDMAPYPIDAFTVTLKQFTPITIEQRPGEQFARIFGHFGHWEGCNRGVAGKCLHPYRSATGYSQFHLGAVRTTEGILSVGKIVQGEGHPDLKYGTKITRAFYDATSKTVAFVRAAEDEFGPYLSGVLAPDITPAEATMLLASPPSADWRNHELISVLAVNVPGHVVTRENLVAGNMTASVRYPITAGGDTDEAELGLIVAEFAQMESDAWTAEAATLCAALQPSGG